MKVVVIGATELTMAVADVVEELSQVEVVGCVGAPPTIRISYAPEGRQNVRHRDLEPWALERDIPYHCFVDNVTLRSEVAEWNADLALVAGWYHLVPRTVRSCFPKGVLGLHASLLPAFRGGAPLNWAILTDAEKTGVSLFRLTDGIDEGPLYGQREVAIGARTTIGDLVQSTTAAGLELIRDSLPAISRGELEPYEQSGTPTYCLHREPEDGRIDWSRSATEIDRLIRSVSQPYPGARAVLRGQELIVWNGYPVSQAPHVWSVPGGVLRLDGHQEPLVVTGSGLLALTEVTDLEGKDQLAEIRSFQRFE